MYLSKYEVFLSCDSCDAPGFHAFSAFYARDADKQRQKKQSGGGLSEESSRTDLLCGGFFTSGAGGSLHRIWNRGV